MDWNCEERCKRLHPHCQLLLARDIAPDDKWHWSVVMPDGHLFDIRGGMTFPEAVSSMHQAGIISLQKADDVWRKAHNSGIHGR